MSLSKYKLDSIYYCENKKSCSHIFSSKKSQESTIYFTQTHNENVVIKCYKIYPDQKPSKVFAMALKEYCFFKVASAMGVGPKTVRSSEFDLIFYENCV